MRFNDAILMAFADGDLPPDEAGRVEAALAEDPDLAARVQRFRAVRTALRTVYDSVAAEPIPEHLRALLGDVASSESPRSLQAAPRPTRSVRTISPAVFAVMAAALILGVLAGRLSAPASGDLTTLQAGRLRASPALARVLDTRVAAAADNLDAALRVGLSFRTVSGGYCRTFREGAASGLACRDGRGWSVPIIQSGAEQADTRSASDSSAVMALVDRLIVGEPLSPEEERRALEQHWAPLPAHENGGTP